MLKIKLKVRILRDVVATEGIYEMGNEMIVNFAEAFWLVSSGQAEVVDTGLIAALNEHAKQLGAEE